MKVAVVVDTFPRWSERFIARELAELKRRGVCFEIFCLKAGALPSDSDPDFEGLLERRVVLPATCSAHSVAAALKGMPKLRENLYARVTPDIASELGLVDLLKLARAEILEKHLREGRFEHVHAHFAGMTSSIAWLAARCAHLPLSISVHARDLFVEPQLMGQKLQDSACIFTCHAHARSYLIDKIANNGRRYSDKVVLMRHGLPLECFKFKKRSAVRRRRPLQILAAGRFVPKKGFGDLVSAIQHPAMAEQNAVLTLLGEGPGRKALVKAARSRRVKSRIVFHEPQCGIKLREIFENSDVFVAPYHAAADGDVDGVPNVVLEAFAMGLPVVGTSEGGLKEVLDTATGTLVPSQNPEALANALAAFVQNSDEALEKTPVARKRVEQEYNIRKNIRPLVELIGRS